MWVHYKGTGTHTGEYLGIAPTGKKIATPSVVIYRIADAKVVERWSIVDMLDFYKQLGIIEYTEKKKETLTSDAEIGNFQAAMNFNTMLSSISVPIASMLLSAFSKLEHKKETIKEFFKISLKFTSMIILPIAILLIVYAQEAVQIIYGSGFELTAYILSLYMIMYLLVGLGYNTLESFFAGIGETKTNLKITIINSITIMVLAPLLTYAFKVTGIIIALILSSLMGTIFGLYTAKKSYEIKMDPKMLIRIYLVALVPALPIFALKWIRLYSNFLTMIIGVATYFAVYLLMVPITGAITQRELKSIKKILERIKLLNYLAKPVFYYEEKIFKTFPQIHQTQ